MVKKYNKKLVGILLAAVITVTTVMPMQGKAAEGNVAAAGAQTLGGENTGGETQTSGRENPGGGAQTSGGENLGGGTQTSGGENLGGGTQTSGGENLGGGTQTSGGENLGGETQMPSEEKPSGGEQEPNGENPGGGVQKPGGANLGGEAQSPNGEATDGEAQEPNGENPDGGVQEPGGENPGGGVQEPNGENPGGGEQEPNGENPDGGIQKPEEEQPGGEIPEEGVLIPEKEKPDGNQPTLEGGLTVEGKEPGDGTEADAEMQEVEITEEEKLKQQEEEANLMLAADIYDVNQPVIESFTFAENGQTLTADDSLHFTISAYDADSGIDSITIRISCQDEFGDGAFLDCIKDGDGNLYSGTLSCSELVGNSFYISSVRVKDKVGNYAEWEVINENWEKLYQFEIGGNVDTHVSVSNVQMQINDANGDGKLGMGETVTYTVDIACDNENIRRVTIDIKCGEGNDTEWITADYDADTQKAMGEYTVTEKTYPGTWKISSIKVYTESGKYYAFYSDEMDSVEDLKFVVEQDGYDTVPPVIESIIIDKNGQYVSPGDVVTIKVKAKDEHLEKRILAHFLPAVSNVSISEYVYLTLDEDSGEYVGTITITEDTYPCEWVLSSLNVRDENGNMTNLSDFQKDYYDTRPWYYRVKAGDTYVENVSDVTFRFYGLTRRQDGNGYSNSLLSEETVKNVGRRASLKELGVALPQHSIEGVSIIGWEYKGILVDENTQLLFNNTSPGSLLCDLQPCYDKGYVEVWIEYLRQQGYVGYSQIGIFVDKEATFKDVLGMLELPADGEANHFTGFELIRDDENSKVGDEAYLSVRAGYDSYPISGTAKYMDKDGNIATFSINKSYPAGTKVKDILLDLEKPADVDGAEFEKWILPAAPEDEDVSIDFVHDFRAIAVYKGKTTVEAEYLYRKEDGRKSYDRKMLLVDGENLSEAEATASAGQGINQFKHFDGLKLKEWASSALPQGQERYKLIIFIAEYSNCVVSLYYPDGTDEYIVMEQGAEFILPTEKGNYKDIVWNGYDKGAKVVVSGDMNFYADGSEYIGDAGNFGDTEPSGGSNHNTGAATPGTTGNAGEVRMPEKKISEITAEIANAANGTAITVDMKNATVVPRQILESIRGKAMDIVLKMNGYSWVINGMDVAATDLKDINLEVKLDTSKIPTSLIQSIAGNKPVRQLSLSHNGDFGFRARLMLNLGSEHSGETGNLYYYDSTGKLVFMDAGEIGKDGTVSMTFSHASDYVVVIDSNAAVKPVEKNVDGGKRKSPKTGEQ